MSRAFACVAAILLAVVATTRLQAFAETPGRADFTARILAIDSIYSDWDSQTILEHQLLPFMPEFKQLVSESDGYVEDCVSFLAEPSHTRQQRFIAISSMYNLSLDNLIYFTNRMIDLHDRRLASADEVMEAIFPISGLGLPEKVPDNFLNRDVRKLLHRIHDMNDLDSGAKFSIEMILLGVDYALKRLGPPDH
jgi:hypothetical protein